MGDFLGCHGWFMGEWVLNETQNEISGYTIAMAIFNITVDQ